MAAPPRPGPLATAVAGLQFPNPLGMAPGFDKDAEVADAVLGLGFGFTEVGTVTPLPQAGNPKPRLFRLTEDRAVINRMGFNNGGRRGSGRAAGGRRNQGGVVGINIGANKDSTDRMRDYLNAFEAVAAAGRLCQRSMSPRPTPPACAPCRTKSALDELLDAVLGSAPRGRRSRRCS